MSLYITCPRCHVSLKANKLPANTKTVSCPECKQVFQVATTGVTAAVPKPKIPVAAAEAQPESVATFATPSSHRGLAVGVIGSILLVGAGVIAAIIYTRQEPQPAAPPPVVAARPNEEPPKPDPNKEKDQAQRIEKFGKLMSEGSTSFNTNHYDDAVAAFTEAATLFPESSEAKAKLGEAQSAQATARQKKQDEDKLREDVVQLVKKGQTAFDEKKFSAAVTFFKLAVEKNPGMAEAAQGLVAAQAALDRDQLDQKKIAEYEQAIDTGKAAMKAGRYADAIRDFISAQRIVPGDAIAMQLQREAEAQLDGLMNRADKMKQFQRLVDQANAAMRAKNYDEADKVFQRALRLFPNDQTALQGADAAQKGLKSAKAEYTVWMNRGAAAFQNGRFAEAVLALREATRLLPDDETASKALRAAELAQERQAAYLRAMEAGATAMGLRQFPAAIVSYNEALRAVPGDLAALQGLQDAQRAFEGDALRRKDFERKAISGLQLLKAQRYGDAESELRAALKLMPNHPDADTVRRQINYAGAMDKAVTAMNARRFSDAIRSYQAALDVYPNDFAANNGLNRAKQMNSKSGKS